MSPGLAQSREIRGMLAPLQRQIGDWQKRIVWFTARASRLGVDGVLGGELDALKAEVSCGRQALLEQIETQQIPVTNSRVADADHALKSILATVARLAARGAAAGGSTSDHTADAPSR
jgi:hypothetical protein